ncbi:SIS domain-containing protein [Acidaminococcus fermentans]|uniref:D-sedoheptulose-7-phosphate isomerase n=1 Tax=Acidaminococcus fermentans TaxID=905 RepID=UPI00307AAB6D
MKSVEREPQKILDDLILRYPVLAACKKDIAEAYCMLRDCYQQGGKLLVAGNGGSAADAEHMVGELMKSFRKPRPLPASIQQNLAATDPVLGIYLAKTLEQPLPAIALVCHEALSTAFLNDKDGKAVFAQQLLGYGKKGDVFLGISTSGNSANVIYAAVVARAIEIPVIELTGNNGGKLDSFANVSIHVPEKETFKIQELHLPVYHCLCMMLEK